MKVFCPSTVQSSLHFAVIVPVYNTAKYLRECFDSLLLQTYKNFTVFAVDDGSIDESAKILDEYAIKDKRIRVIHKDNGGVSKARNIALDLIEAEGCFDFIIFLDSDDYWSSNCLETIAKAATETRADIVAFGIEAFDRNSIIIDPKKRKHEPIFISNGEAFCLFTFANIKKIPFKNKKILSIIERSPARSNFIGNIAFRSSPVLGLRFNVQLRATEDQDFRVHGFTRCTNCVVISDCLYRYRLRSNSLSHSREFAQSDLLLCLSWLKTIENLPIIGRIAIEQKTFAIWWKHLELLNKTHSLENEWDNCRRYLKEMRKLFISSAFHYPKALKHIVIFQLGHLFTIKYFSCRQAKNKISKKIEHDSYF